MNKYIFKDLKAFNSMKIQGDVVVITEEYVVGIFQLSPFLILLVVHVASHTTREVTVCLFIEHPVQCFALHSFNNECPQLTLSCDLLAHLWYVFNNNKIQVVLLTVGFSKRVLSSHSCAASTQQYAAPYLKSRFVSERWACVD